MEITRKTLTRLGLSHLNPLGGEYVEARALEAEGWIAQLRGNSRKMNDLYFKALRIFDKLGLSGECLRLSERLGNLDMSDRYLNHLRATKDVSLECLQPCGIADNFSDWPRGAA